MSFMYIRKRHGPRTEPWGMSDNTGQLFDVWPQYTLHNQILKSTNTAKYLSVTITNDLTWNHHINNITNKANASFVGLIGVCDNLLMLIL
jgi:hypothetical protein